MKTFLVLLIGCGIGYAQQTCPTGYVPLQGGTTTIPTSNGGYVISNGLCINPTTGAVVTVPGGAGGPATAINQSSTPSTAAGNINYNPLASGPYLQYGVGGATGNIAYLLTTGYTTGHCVMIGNIATAPGELLDSGAACGSGGSLPTQPGYAASLITNGTTASWGPPKVGSSGILCADTGCPGGSNGSGLDVIPTQILLPAANNVLTGGSWNATAEGMTAPVQTGSTVPSSCTVQGQLFYLTTTNLVYNCNGTTFQLPSSGGAPSYTTADQGLWITPVPQNSATSATVLNVPYAEEIQLSGSISPKICTAYATSAVSGTVALYFYNAAKTLITPGGLATVSGAGIVTFSFGSAPSIPAGTNYFLIAAGTAGFTFQAVDNGGLPFGVWQIENNSLTSTATGWTQGSSTALSTLTSPPANLTAFTQLTGGNWKPALYCHP